MGRAILPLAAIGDRSRCSRSCTSSAAAQRPRPTLFQQLVTAWALRPGRRTLTGYGASSRLVVHLVEHWVPEGLLAMLLDDTVVNKCGRKVDGAGFFHDPITSTAVAAKVTAWA